MSKIPVYQVEVPEYKLKKFRSTSKKVDYAVTPLFNLRIPKVYADNKPDFDKIGAKIDKRLKKHFLGKKVVIRVLDSEEHKGKSVDDLIRIIKRIDIAVIYDPNQLEVVEHKYKGRQNEIKKDGYIFKNPDKKPKAILGIIKIL